PMVGVPDVRAVAGGLEGDRYLTRRGYWSGVDECEVTLIQGEVLDDIPASYGVTVANGEHRRNIVTRGVNLGALAGTHFAVGAAVSGYDAPRPPCRYAASLTEPGMTRALAARRGGVCAYVVEPGVIRVGDPIRLVSPLST